MLSSIFVTSLVYHFVKESVRQWPTFVLCKWSNYSFVSQKIVYFCISSSLEDCYLKNIIFFQYSTYQQLKEQKKSEKFFKVLYDRMKAAQQEIRSTVTVNTIDLGSKKKDDDSDLTISIPKKRGKEAPM